MITRSEYRRAKNLIIKNSLFKYYAKDYKEAFNNIDELKDFLKELIQKYEINRKVRNQLVDDLGFGRKVFYNQDETLIKMIDREIDSKEAI